MGNDRREFLKRAGIAGIGLAGAGMSGVHQPGSNDPFSRDHPQEFNMHGYAAPALDTVRMGLIGIGSRGSGTVRRMAGIEGVEIMALCDLYESRVNEGLAEIEDFPQHSPDSYFGGEDEWRKVCEREDIDLIYTATPWRLHGIIAMYAMEHDKHVYTELPVGNTIEEIWDVVETSERTRKHCFMGCGSCHDGMDAVTLNMVRQGFFGELVHGEGNYIHDRASNTEGRFVRDEDDHGWFGFRPWRLKENAHRNGNLYPQHGLGPLAQIMDLNYGDQMDYMVSISSNDFTLGPKMKEMAERDEYFEPYVHMDFRGNMNTSIIRTRKGRTIMLQHDISTPRPGSRFQLISGTKGIYHARPSRVATSDHGWLPEEEFEALVAKYTPEITKRFEQRTREAQKISTERSYSEVNASDWRLIDCLRNGLPLEMDVYDAALWSSITPLSEWSVARQGASVKVPDFTRGAWQSNEQGMDIAVKKGGSTRLI